MNSRLSAALLLASAALLSACGFHLRGNADYTFATQTLDVKARDAYGETARALRNQLENNGVHLQADAPYRLVLTNESENQRVLSHNGAARSAEYELTSHLDFELRDRANLVLLSDQLQAWKTYVYDDSNLVSSNEEAQRLRGEIRQELLQQLLQRLQQLTPAQLAKRQADAEARTERSKQPHP